MAKKDKPDVPPGTPWQKVLPLLITFAVIACIGPMLFSAYWIKTFSSVAALILVSGTVALLYGQLGMVSLAQFALSGVGGWVTLRLVHGTPLPFEVCLLAGALVAGLFGLLVGLPALRMRGLYLALITLMMAAAFQVVVNVISFPDGGTGFTGKIVAGQRVLIERPWIARGDGAYFVYVMFWSAAGMGLIEWLRATRAGRAWALIRKSEAAAIAAGVSVVRYKAGAFALAGALAGLAGGLIAGLNGQLDSTGFHASQSILAYALTVVGGSYHWMGSVFAGLLMRAVPALLNDHGVDGNLANVFFGFALLVSLIQGRKGLAGALADFYKFVRMSRIVEGSVQWAVVSIGLSVTSAAMGWTSFAGALFIVLIALLFRMAIPTVCWMLLGFFGKGVQDRIEDIEGALSLRLSRVVEAAGFVPDHRIVKRALNALFVGLFVAWVAWGVFDVPFVVGLALIWVAMALKALFEWAVYPRVLPLRRRIDARWPKPHAAYR